MSPPSLLTGSLESFLAIAYPPVHTMWLEAVASLGEIAAALAAAPGEELVRAYLEAVREAAVLPPPDAQGWIAPTVAAARFQHLLSDLRVHYPIDAFHQAVSRLHGSLRLFLSSGALTPMDRALLHEAADAVLDAVMAESAQEWAYVQAQTASLKNELSGLYRIASSVSTAFEPAVVLEAIVGEISSLLGSDLCAVLLPSPEGDALLVTACEANEGLKRLMDGMRFPLAETGVVARVFREGETRISSSPIQDLNLTMRRRATLEALGFRHLLVAPLKIHNRTIGVAAVANHREDRRFNPAAVDLLSTMCAQAAATLWIAQLFSANRAMSLDLVRTLAQALDARDSYTNNHSQNVATVARLIAEELELPPDEVDTIYTAGLLHDLGKIGIADAVLHKPGALSRAERHLMMQHPEKGAQILEPVRGLRHVIPAVMHHHERFDGKGYPDGLAGEQIPLGARILAVSDAFDVMNNHRVYRRARTQADLLQEFAGMAGKQFDPAIVAALLSLLEKRPEGLELKTSSVFPAAGTYYADGPSEGLGPESRDLEPVRTLFRAIERFGHQPLVLEDARPDDADLVGVHELPVDAPLLSYAGQPIGRVVAPEGEVEAIADLAGAVQELLSRQEDVESQLSLYRRLAEIGPVLHGAAAPEAVLQTAVEQAKRMLGVDIAGIWLVHDDHHLSFAASAGKSRQSWPHRLRIGTEGLAGYVAYMRVPTAVVDYGIEVRFDVPQWVLDEGLTSSCAVPLQLGARLLGVFVLMTHEARVFAEFEVAVLEQLAHHTASALENARMQETQRHHTLRDPLTGLANYRHFHERFAMALTHAQRQGQHLALLLLDVDELDGINRAHGHAAGDAALRHVAEVVRPRLSDHQHAARLGAGTFALVLPGANAASAAALAADLQLVLADQPVTVRPHVHATVRLHLAAVAALPDESPQALLERGLAALACDKAATGA